MKNIGIIGLGNIAHRVAKGILCSSKAKLYAVASRDIKKAQNFAQCYQADVFYGSYEQMLQDPKVDIVYICTINSLHYQHIQLCLAYKKHVICEKPMVKTVDELKELFAYAKKQGCFLMEAHKTMFIPLNKKIKSMIKDGVIGKLHTIRGDYCCNIFNDVNKNHWLLQDDFAGCSYDIGVYTICLAHYYADANVKSFKIEKVKHPQYACDFGMEIDCFYENEIYANLKANWFYDKKGKGKALLIGNKGYIEIEAYWKTNKAYLYQGNQVSEISVAMESDFEGEITHAIECIEQDLLESDVLSEVMSIEMIKMIEE